MPSTNTEHDTQSQSTAWVTIPGSFIMTRNPAEWPFFYFPPPPAPEPQREPLTPGDLRAAMLHAADCLDTSLEAQIDGDEAELLRYLETVRGLVAAITGQLRGSSSENFVTLQ